MKNLFSLFILIACISAFAQDTTRTYLTDSLVVTATRVGENSPFAHSNVSGIDLKKRNLGTDMPYLLDHTPSVVVASDGGTGIGYTGIRVRGSDPSRINITINGIPLNDAESQQVYWVNMPDFASSTNGVQIQRGIGSSTNGAGAFGATINLQTNQLRSEAYAETSHSFGSYNTRRHNVQFGTGLLHKHWTFDGRLSQISSDGYIIRSGVDLQSYYAAAGYTDAKTNLRFITFSGHEITQQAWDGVPADSLKTNRRYNPRGVAYDNEIDDYRQTHYQLHISRELLRGLSFTGALHATLGKGFFEQWKSKDELANYGLSPIIQGADTLRSTDIIRRRWLDNNFFGAVYSFQYQSENHKLTAILGGGWNRYDGDHFGEIIWMRAAGTTNIRYPYYRNNAVKTDFNSYLKATYNLTQDLSLFADMQIRTVGYAFKGINDDLRNVDGDTSLVFFNPKGGISYTKGGNNFYASYAIGNREPNRNDYVDNNKSNRYPNPETLRDFEAGYRRTGKIYRLEANFYRMDYRNELVPTGKLNDVGVAIRVNVPKSYRMGIELSGSVAPIKWLSFSGNVTFSQNKIVQFTEYVDVFDKDFNWVAQKEVTHRNTALGYAPAVIASGEAATTLLNTSHQTLSLAWVTKYVGKQYLDNTQNENRVLDAWLIHDARLNYCLKNIGFVKEIAIDFTARNVFSRLYSANGWAYGYYLGDQLTSDRAYYPQAPANWLGGISLRW